MINKHLYQQVLDKWGMMAQLDMVVEECSELIKAVQKYKRHADSGTYLSIMEETADVEIMVEQLRVMFDTSVISYCKQTKLDRLQRRVNK